MRILLFKTTDESEYFNSDDSILPLSGFEARYSANEIPCEIVYSKRKVFSPDKKQLVIDQGEYFVAIEPDKIVRIESSGNECYLYVGLNQFWTVNMSLDEFEKKLTPFHFFRIHHNHIINLDKMEKLVSCSAYITLTNQVSVPVEPGKDKLIIEYLENKKML